MTAIKLDRTKSYGEIIGSTDGSKYDQDGHIFDVSGNLFQVEQYTETPEMAYEKKFGKPPHHRMKLENIIAAIEE